MIFSLIIFIWLQKSGGLIFKVEGLKPPCPPLPTPMPSVLPSATAVKIEVKSQA